MFLSYQPSDLPQKNSHERETILLQDIKQDIEDHIICEQNYDNDRIDIFHHKIEI